MASIYEIDVVSQDKLLAVGSDLAERDVLCSA